MPAYKYRERVKVVDALQYDGTNVAEVLEFGAGYITEVDGGLVWKSGVLTLELLAGQWVLKDAAEVVVTFPEETFPIYYQPGGADME